MPRQKTLPSPVALACLQCRGKHVRCDGATPICRRCQTNSLQCTFTASLRGYRRQRNTANHSESVGSVGEEDTVCLYVHSSAATLSSSRDTLNDDNLAHSQSTSVTEVTQPSHGLPLLNPTGNPIADDTITLFSEAEKSRFVASYYSNFHPSHPLLVPRAFYQAQNYPEVLDTTVCLVGSFYLENLPQRVSQAASRLVSTPSDTKSITLHHLQALVIFSIVLHSLQQVHLARLCIDRAADISLKLGLHQLFFAKTNVTSFVEEESLRRTWWELYITETYLTILHRATTSSVELVQPMPQLPCSEAHYESGTCDESLLSLTGFESRFFFTHPGHQYSTFCYRIESARLMQRFIVASRKADDQPDTVQTLDSLLTSWSYHLPREYTQLVDHDLKLNQHIFQACTFIHCTCILLHFPRSDLSSTLPSATEIACVSAMHSATPTETNHALKAIVASKEICQLATIPGALEQCSPFFVCAVILSGVVQLAAACVHGEECPHGHKDLTIVILGILLRLGERWPVAQSASRQMRKLANIIFLASDPLQEEAWQAPSLDLSAWTAGMDWLDFFSSNTGPESKDLFLPDAQVF